MARCWPITAPTHADWHYTGYYHRFRIILARTSGARLDLAGSSDVMVAETTSTPTLTLNHASYQYCQRNIRSTKSEVSAKFFAPSYSPKTERMLGTTRLGNAVS